MFQPYFKLFLFISIFVVIINLRSVTAGISCFGGNGFYPAWTHWSQCSVTCGEGKRTRECRCFDDNDKATSNEGEGGCTSRNVNLQVVDNESCKLKDCPGDDDEDFEPFIIIIIVILILPLLKLFG